MFDVFPKFHAQVESFFNHKIHSLYTGGGTEYIKLKSFFQNHGISHYISPPYTPEHVELAERKHRHIVKTSLALLNHASKTMVLCFPDSRIAHKSHAHPKPSK